MLLAHLVDFHYEQHIYGERGTKWWVGRWVGAEGLW